MSRPIAFWIFALLFASTGHAQQIIGAGGTFPAPIYAKWADAARAAIGVNLSYQAIGSSLGQDKIIARSVDFGASDAPMSTSRLAAENLLQFPTVMGAVVIIVNLPRVREGELKLTGDTLADIFAGKIRKWNDRRLAEINPDLTLPNISIAPVHRFEGSGTTFVFTSYLSTASAAWKSEIGAANDVKWPAGAGARGSDGVASTVNITRGGIGYVENSFAEENHLTTARLRNKSGVFIKPTTASFAAAAQAGDWNTPNLAANLIDTEGAANWPIVSSTYVLVPTDLARSAAVIIFFDWAFRNGAAIAEKLDYIMLPSAVQDAVRSVWHSRVLSGDKSSSK